MPGGPVLGLAEHPLRAVAFVDDAGLSADVAMADPAVGALVVQLAHRVARARDAGLPVRALEVADAGRGAVLEGELPRLVPGAHGIRLLGRRRADVRVADTGALDTLVAVQTARHQAVSGAGEPVPVHRHAHAAGGVTLRVRGGLWALEPVPGADAALAGVGAPAVPAGETAAARLPPGAVRGLAGLVHEVALQTLHQAERVVHTAAPQGPRGALAWPGLRVPADEVHGALQALVARGVAVAGAALGARGAGRGRAEKVVVAGQARVTGAVAVAGAALGAGHAGRRVADETQPADQALRAGAALRAGTAVGPRGAGTGCAEADAAALEVRVTGSVAVAGAAFGASRAGLGDAEVDPGVAVQPRVAGAVAVAGAAVRAGWAGVRDHTVAARAGQARARARRAARARAALGPGLAALADAGLTAAARHRQQQQQKDKAQQRPGQSPHGSHLIRRFVRENRYGYLPGFSIADYYCSIRIGCPE